jgi:siroheme synthase-like protein
MKSALVRLEGKNLDSGGAPKHTSNENEVLFSSPQDAGAMYFPLLFKEGFSCLIIGGGKVAARKVEILSRIPCSLTVIAPSIDDSIAGAVSHGFVRWISRIYEGGDCSGYQLIIAATRDRSVNREVFLEAAKLGIPVNVVDDPELCTVIFPAVWQNGGVAPFMTVAIRDLLAGQLEQMVKWVETGGRFRQAVRNSIGDEDQKNKLYQRFLHAGRPNLCTEAPRSVELNDWLAWLDRVERIGANDRQC